MATIGIPEDTFLDNGAYDKFVAEVAHTFNAFLSELPSWEQLTNSLRNTFDEKNYAMTLLLLEQNKTSLSTYHLYISVVKEIKRLVKGEEIRHDFLFSVKAELLSILDLAISRKDEEVTKMVSWLEKNEKVRLSDWKMMLRGMEREIFKTQEHLCSHLSNQEVYEKYKHLVDTIRKAEHTTHQIRRI